MTIASEITRINGNIAAAYTACNDKGATMPVNQNSANLATCIGTISTGGSGGKYSLLERIKDDNNNEIGTVSGFFKDANDVEYAVVCLDAQYRLASQTWISDTGTVTNLTNYNMNSAGIDLITNVYTDTATDNCTKILAWCIANGYTSDSVSHCRSLSFIVDGITYYGQLPNLCELFYVAANHIAISNADTGKGSYPSNDIATWKNTWTSTQANNNNSWLIGSNGTVGNNNKTSSFFVIPVLEIPNN